MDTFPSIQITVTGPVEVHLATEQLMSSVAEVLASQQTSIEHLLAMQVKMDSIIAVLTSLRNQGGASATELDAILAAAQTVQTNVEAVEAQEDLALLDPLPPA